MPSEPLRLRAGESRSELSAPPGVRLATPERSKGTLAGGADPGALVWRARGAGGPERRVTG
eukprot:4938087-Pyramimonas_sp.AAC.1